VFEFNKLFKCETSGTSGQVLKFSKNEEWDSFTRASMMRGYSWYGINPWDFNIYFWGYNTRFLSKIKIRILDKLVNRWRIFNYDKKSISRLEQKIKKSVYIEGYSSMIYELSKIAVSKDIRAAKLKMIKGTSEKIFPHYQKAVFEAFGLKMISEYGAAEAGIIAFECPKGNMHINMEGVIVEVNEMNEILVTNLYSYSFPIIRYKLGDVVSLAAKSVTCNCGLHHPILIDVTGRIGKNIHGLTKKFPSLTLYYIFKNIYFNYNFELNYQAHQNIIGRLDIWLDIEITEFLSTIIKQEAFKYFETEIEVELTFSNCFRGVKGKLRDFITTLE
jgi:phenylacetate-CoA ligase